MFKWLEEKDWDVRTSFFIHREGEFPENLHSHIHTTHRIQHPGVFVALTSHPNLLYLRGIATKSYKPTTLCFDSASKGQSKKGVHSTESVNS